MQYISEPQSNVAASVVRINLDFKELTKNIASRKEMPHQEWTFDKESVNKLSPPSLRKNFIAIGMLCKDCHRYMARDRYSVCETCFKRRMRRFVKSGGIYILSDRARNQLENE